MSTWQIYHGDVREQLALIAAGSVQCCVTSPPYWGLRDYGHAGQIGLEPTPDAYVAQMVDVFRLVRRALKDDGTLWLNLGDSYAMNLSASSGGNTRGGLSAAASKSDGRDRPGNRSDKNGEAVSIGVAKTIPVGLKPKDLVGIPWRVAFALQADGWYLRSDIIWSKAAPMPESVTDRPTKSHEYIFLLSKNARYFYDSAAIAEAATYPDGMNGKGPVKSPYGQGFAAGRSDGATTGTRNKRSVWHIGPQPFTDWTKTVRRVRVAPGDADGDTKRITSPDCPVHGDRSALVATALYGEREAAESNRTARNDADHVQAPLLDCAPIAQRHEPDSRPQSSGSHQPERSDSASDRSTRSRKTARVPVTTAPCIASAETGGGTGDTSASPDYGEPSDRSVESRNGRACSGAHLSAETIDRIARTVSSSESCICELYKEITEEMSHFATYPEKLIEPCILAGSRVGDIVLDPFTGSGTTGAVAVKLGRAFVGCELNAEYVQLARRRIGGAAPLFAEERTA